MVKPALDRNRKRGKRTKTDRLPTRDEYVMAGVRLGGDADALGAAYDQWAATRETTDAGNT